MSDEPDVGGGKLQNGKTIMEDAGKKEEAPQVAVKPSKTGKKEKEKKEKKEKKDVVKKGPTSVVAKLALQRIKMLEEAGRQQREEEERERKLEEERIQKAEEDKKKEEEKEQRRFLRLQKREAARKEGKLISAKEKAARLKNQAFAQQLHAQGVIVPPPSSGIGCEKKSKVIDNRRKKKKKDEEGDKKEDFGGGGVDETSTLKPEGENHEDTLDVQEAENLDVAADWEAALMDSEGEGETSKLPRAIAVGSAHPVPTLAANERASDTKSLLSSRVDSKKTASSTAPTTSPGSLLPPAPNSVATTNAIEGKAVKLRSPICCILGHVDTGKTKLLDKIRKTNVQDNEAGGITQQIGATFCPADALAGQCRKVEEDMRMDVPGLLIIDTPGHESFNNLRARGSSLCDIAILVVDIMHGLEPQTRESLGLLKARKCPFIIALNKIDRMYDWIACSWEPTRDALTKQTPHARDEFRKRYEETLLELKAEGMNCALYWENDDIRRVVSIVPTSAINGEGLPDLLMLLIKLTQSVMTKTIEYMDDFQCTILEVKAIDGLGITIDVILANGSLREGDEIVVCGMSGPIVTSVRALLTPQPMKELRVKGEYIHHKLIHAAMGVKISAQGLDDAVAGTSVLLRQPNDDLDDLKESVMQDMASIFHSVDRSGSGVYVMASTLGSLEALLQFLKDSKIPVFAVNIGTVHKMDVKKASIMREKGHPELSVILAFDIKVDPEAEKEAKQLGVRIMTADIIYHLFDEFTKYLQETKEEKKRDKAGEAIFPCVLSIIPQYVFNKKDPLILGVKVDDGILRVGTPLAVPDKDFLKLGRVSSLEHNKKAVEKATKGMEVAIKIVGEPNVAYGRHFDQTNKVYSRITRDSIDCLKEHFRDELSKDDWRLVIQMKKVFDIL